MRLFRLEFEKIAFRRTTVIFMASVIVINLILFFLIHVWDESSIVDGREYRGMAAIRKDREITREYAGEFTDEKAREIIARYGFPIYKENYPLQGNYINKLVAAELTQINQGVQPHTLEELRPVEEAVRAGNKPVLFGYARGWEVLTENLNFMLIILFIFLIIAVSPIFAEEFSLGTASVVLASERGKKQDTVCRICAALAYALSCFLIAFLSNTALCAAFYGTEGLDTAMALILWNYTWQGSIGEFIIMFFLIGMVGTIIHTAAILAVSAAARHSFNALTVSAVLFLAPLGIWLVTMPFISGGFLNYLLRLVISSTPLMLAMPEMIMNTAPVRQGQLLVWAVFFAECLAMAYRKYPKRQIS